MIAPDGPFKVELTFAFTDGGRGVEASYALPPGQLPNEASIREAVKEIMDQLSELGPDFRLKTRHEFVLDVMRERTGMAMSVPGPDSFSLEL